MGICWPIWFLRCYNRISIWLLSNSNLTIWFFCYWCSGKFSWCCYTGTSSVGLPGSVILPVPGTYLLGSCLWYLTLPSWPILTVIGPFFTWDFYLSSWWECSSLLSLLVLPPTSPVLGSRSTSSVGVLRAGVVTFGTSSVGHLVL